MRGDDGWYVIKRSLMGELWPRSSVDPVLRDPGFWGQGRRGSSENIIPVIFPCLIFSSLIDVCVGPAINLCSTLSPLHSNCSGRNTQESLFHISLRNAVAQRGRNSSTSLSHAKSERHPTTLEKSRAVPSSTSHELVLFYVSVSTSQIGTSRLLPAWSSCAAQTP